MTVSQALIAGAAAVSHEVFPSIKVRPADPKPIWKVTTLPDGQLVPSKTYARAEEAKPEAIMIAKRLETPKAIKGAKREWPFTDTIKARFMRI
jgi:hypothetical protein